MGVVLDSSETLQFTLNLVKIEEVSASGAIVESVPIQISDVNVASYSTGNSVGWNYVARFPNSAYMEFDFTMSDSPRDAEFANETYILQANTVKSTITIVEWPFKSMKNRLLIYATLAAQDPTGKAPKVDCEEYISKQDDSGNLRWVQYIVNGKTMYGTFLQNALIDQSPQPMGVSLDQKSSHVVLTVPFFWSTVTIDPDFSVLVQTDPDSKCQTTVESESIKIIIMIVVPLALLAIIAAFFIAYFFARRRRRAFTRQMSGLEKRLAAKPLATTPSTSPLTASPSLTSSTPESPPSSPPLTPLKTAKPKSSKSKSKPKSKAKSMMRALGV